MFALLVAVGLLLLDIYGDACASSEAWLFLS